MGKETKEGKRCRDSSMSPEDCKQREDTHSRSTMPNHRCVLLTRQTGQKSRYESHCMEFAPQDSAHTSQCDLCWALVVPDSTASWFLISSFFPVYVSEAAQVVQVIFKCLPGPSGLRAGRSPSDRWGLWSQFQGPSSLTKILVLETRIPRHLDFRRCL